MKTLSWRRDFKLNAARPRNIVTKRLPHEACFDQGDGQVEKDVVN